MLSGNAVVRRLTYPKVFPSVEVESSLSPSPSGEDLPSCSVIGNALV